MMRTGTIEWDFLLSTWGERWAWTLLHSLWQDGLLTIGLWIVLRLLPARHADVRYSATLAAFALAALAPIATWAWLGAPTAETSLVCHPTTMPAPTAQVADAPITAQSGPRVDSFSSPSAVGEQQSIATLLPSAVSGVARYSRIVVPVILTLWGLGVAIQLARTIRDLAATRELLCGEPAASASLQACLARIVELLQIRRRFQVVVSATQAGPFIFGLWKPTLVLPAALIAGLTPEQLEAVLLHELAHLRRYDDVINFIQLLAEAIFFFNPGLGWISRELRREREASCDARAVACLASPLPLAQALAQVAEGWSTSVAVPMSLLGFAKETEPGILLDRVERILAPGHRPQLRLSWRALALTLVLVGILLCGLEQTTSWSVDLAKRLLSPAERIAVVAAVQKEIEGQDSGDPDAKFLISGTIRTENGGSLPERGSLHSICRKVSGGGSSSVGTSHVISGDTFKVSLNTGQCWLMCSTEGYAPVLAGPFRGRPGQDLDGVEIMLKQGVSGGFRVVDRQGRPIAKASVVAVPDWGKDFWIGPAVPMATDDDGFWKSEHLADVPYRVSVHAAGFTPHEPTESHPITKVPLVIALDCEKPITGIVVDAAGKPVEDAVFRVVAEKRGNHNSYHGDSGKVLAESRADGTFEVGDLALNTEYSLLIDAGERGHAVLANARAGMGLIRVVLQKKLVLAGEVRGDLRPLTKNGHVAIDCLTTADGTVSHRISTTLDDKGRFRFDALFAGKYQLTIGTHVISGRADESVNNFVIDLAQMDKTNAARDVEIRFTEGESPVTPAGTIVAQMEVVDGRGQPRFGGALPIIDGVVRLRMRTPGTLRIVANGCLGYWFADFNTEVVAAADSFQARVPVVPAGAIRVKVVSPDKTQNRSGAPGAGVQFYHNTIQGKQMVSFWQNTVSSNEVVLSPVPLEVDCLVSAMQGFRVVRAPILSLEGAEPVRDVTLQLPKAIDAVVRVESEDGTPLSQIPIEVNHEPPLPPQRATSGDLSPGGHTWGGDRQTDRNGQTILAGMPENGAGYTVKAQPTRDWQVGRADVRTDGGVTVLKLQRGLAIEGRVIDKMTGRPVSGIEIRAWPASRPLGGLREFPAEAPTDANGNFRFSNLPHQTVKLIAWGTYNAAQPEVEPGQSEPVTLKVQVPD